MMRWTYKLPLRLRSLFRKDRVEKELSDELRFLVEKLIDENIAQGMSPEEARYMALRELGGVEQIKEECRDMRRVNYLQNFFQDLRFGSRMLAKNPGFTVAVVATLALGIGVNTAIFTVVNSVLLRPLPFRAPDRLVRLGETDLHEAPSIGQVSYPNFLDWRAQNHVFESIAAFHSNSFTLGRATGPVFVEGAVVSADLFSLLGVAPILGRSFLPEEDPGPGAGRGRPVILGYDCWRSYFGLDLGILGRSVDLDDQSFTIIGVMPNGFQYPIQADPVELWTTFAVDAEAADNKPPATAERSARYLAVIARLKSNLTLAQARADMATVARNLEQAYPGPNSSTGAWLIPELQAVVGDRRSTLLVLFGTVAFVLLIACANVANLLLARSVARHREIAVRAALGASRRRLIGQAATETLLLSAFGGSVGVALSLGATDLFIKLGPHNICNSDSGEVEGAWEMTAGVCARGSAIGGEGLV